MNSIYVAIPSLNDKQLRYTLKDLIDNCSKDNIINIGLPIFSNDKFFNKIKKEFSTYKNIKMQNFDPKLEYGVGNGRYRAMSFYDGEDYVLQIDSHTKIEKDWDKFLISLHQEAMLTTENEKTILTAYLGYYSCDKNNRYIRNSLARYPFFSQDFFPQTIIPRWKDMTLEDFVNEYVNYKWLPAVKFNANFAFGNKYFAENTGLYRNAYFLEEEICQTINLLDLGFSLVFPNQILPLTHLYVDHLNRHSKRTGVTEISKVENEGRETNKRYLEFILDINNKEKIERFKEYAKVNPLSGTIIPMHIPSNFNKV